MRVTLDLTKLRQEGRITPEEFEKFSRFAAEGTGSVGFNILIGFGVVAVSLGLLALVPSHETALVLGPALAALGFTLLHAAGRQWEILATICLIVGALLFGGGVVLWDGGEARAFALVAVVFAAVGIAARSALLIAGAVLALAAMLGAGTGYARATYFLSIREPAFTVVVFSVFAIGAYQLSRFVSADFERLALAAARTAVFLINLGFWIGSIWGDRVEVVGVRISAGQFALLWAVALIGAAVWATYRNRPWVLNVAAAFGAIHFYTQWFAYFGAHPFSLLLAGLVALGFALALWRFNRGLSGKG